MTMKGIQNNKVDKYSWVQAATLSTGGLDSFGAFGTLEDRVRWGQVTILSPVVLVTGVTFV